MIEVFEAVGDQVGQRVERRDRTVAVTAGIARCRERGFTRVQRVATRDRDDIGDHRIGRAGEFVANEHRDRVVVEWRERERLELEVVGVDEAGPARRP